MKILKILNPIKYSIGAMKKSLLMMGLAPLRI
jgi:hypothetical protein